MKITCLLTPNNILYKRKNWFKWFLSFCYMTKKRRAKFSELMYSSTITVRIAQANIKTIQVYLHVLHQTTFHICHFTLNVNIGWCFQFFDTKSMHFSFVSSSSSNKSNNSDLSQTNQCTTITTTITI